MLAAVGVGDLQVSVLRVHVWDVGGQQDLNPKK